MNLGYVILYVEDVAAALAFYERAFGLERRFFHDEAGKAYGELETGGTRLAFVNHALAEESLGRPFSRAQPGEPPQAVEVGLIADDVPAAFARAVDAGAVALKEPATKPWGQTVSYLRDPDGHLIELCTPMP
ncbi:MAG: VOC family protein [Alphaproteobacteria bacterium]|nr:VOC family protein [Alphaproteobacteria bacterium]MBV9371354.1 VOC family protein [Alphaproteobacteria bacterium]MBV9901818.1 VOC family protein [Alphaproteobacteria bacterium]